MTFEEKLNEYARLIVMAGVHVNKGQQVLLRCPLECYEFGRRVVREAYEAGASEVVIKWSDAYCERLRYDNAPMEVLSRVRDWAADELNTLAKENTAFISLTGADPEAFKGIPPEKLQAGMKESHAKLADYIKLQSSMGIKWTVAAVPTHAWAQKVFPGMQEDVAVTRLWDAIFMTVRIGDGPAYEKWLAHAENLAKKCAVLNEWQLRSLHYENSLGTDFTVGLVENHRWEGGADRDKENGAPFFANMPTEEVFTMPDNRKAEGRLVASMPLSVRGNLAENFEFTFKDGKVVDCKAEKGLEALQTLLGTDEGAARLGECALVSFPSAVSATGILFLNTLFDENAACHFALGRCYETNLIGGPEMSEEELASRGGNQSMIHVDFMVGTKDLKITGVTKDGETVTVFRDGTWAF